MYGYSDLACERARAETNVDGVHFSKEKSGGFETERVTVRSKEGEESIGRPMGIYVTHSFPPPWELSEEEKGRLSELIGKTLQELLPRENRERLLVFGLGNERLTADSIGPKAVKGIHATLHLSSEEKGLFERLSCSAIAALCPGVLADTGIETSTLAKITAKEVGARAVIVIDALAARSTERLVRTVQLSDTGIVPGSGVGNHRRELSRRTLGIPVIAIGIPTVVGAHVLVRDALTESGVPLSDGSQGMLSEEERLFVSPKECDIAVEILAKILSEAINSSFGVSLSV